MTDLSKTSGTSPPRGLGDFPAHLFGPQITRPDVRYFITPELEDSFSEEQIEKQRDLMIKTGRWLLPNDGDFALRIFNYRRTEFDLEEHEGPPRPGYQYVAFAFREAFVDLHYKDGKIVSVDHTERRQYPNLARNVKLAMLETEQPESWPDIYDYRSRVFWWERGGWFCNRKRVLDSVAVRVDDDSVLAMSVIALQSRFISKIATSARDTDGEGLGLDKNMPEGVKTVTLYCPGRVSSGNGNGEARGAQPMNLRSGHGKLQPYGPRHSLRKEIYVEGYWVNAEDVAPEDRGTPVRRFQLAPGGV
jgi:hypothetical protein